MDPDQGQIVGAVASAIAELAKLTQLLFQPFRRLNAWARYGRDNDTHVAHRRLDRRRKVAYCSVCLDAHGHAQRLVKRELGFGQCLACPRCGEYYKETFAGWGPEPPE